jgi:hypothetical protein
MLPFMPSSSRSFGRHIEVDNTGLDQPAQLEQMMPVAAVPSEPRGIEAEYSADLAGAQRGDQSVEAGPVDSAARGTAEIVVDDLDFCEAAPPCGIDEFVLAPLALQVRPDLLRRRLTDIDNRFALQHGCRKQSVMRGHRRPPVLRRRPLREVAAPAT